MIGVGIHVVFLTARVIVFVLIRVELRLNSKPPYGSLCEQNLDIDW